MEVEVIEDLASAERVWSSWDDLAVALSTPYGAPAWQLGWWRAGGPSDARPVILTAREDGALVGVLSLWAQRTRSGVERLRIMGALLAQCTGPLVRPGREQDVARDFAVALAGLRPRPATLEFEGVNGGRRWADMLAEAWPGRVRPRWHVHKQVIAPLVHLDGSNLDDWLGTRSSNFRQQMRRSRRALGERGAVFSRAVTPDAIASALPELLRLHHARWDPRGGSRAVDDRSEAALVEVARRLCGEEQRMHIELIDLDGQTISAHLFVAAGEESVYWLGGFDDAHSRERPGLVAIVNAVEHALERGRQRLDLGPGRGAYKLRFADAERTLDWGHLVLPGPQMPFTHLRLMPGRVARRVLRAG